MDKAKFVVIILLALLMGFSKEEKSSKPTDTPVALVKKIVKDVTYKSISDVSDWEKAKVGSPLNDGGEVKTGTKSLALVLFTDGSGLLRVRENSILNIYGERKDRKMNKNTFIQKGLIGFDVSKQAEDEEFKFTTPTVVASIRGTDGYVNVEDDSTTTIVLESGSAYLTARQGSQQSTTLTSGNKATIDKYGNMESGGFTESERQTYKQTLNTNTKKLKIRTNQVEIEIEYYTNQQ